MISYSPRAQLGRAYLTQSHSDLDVYVEDTRIQNAYVRLINRILRPQGKRVSRVIPLGGRKAVLDACVADSENGGRKRLYVIDGDLDLLCGRAQIVHPRLYQLRVYSVESLLLSEQSVLAVAEEGDAETPVHRLQEQIAWERRSDAVARMLTPLFVVYAVAYLLQARIGIETVAFSSVRLCRQPNDPDSLCIRQVRRRVREIREAVVAASSVDEYRVARQSIRTVLAGWQGRAIDLLSAKTNLLPLLVALLRREAAFRDGIDNLCVRLAASVELEIDRGFASAVTSAAA